MVLLFSKFSSFFFDENGIFWKFVPGILLTGFSFAGAGMFYGIEGGNNSTETGCPQFTFWSSLFYVNTVITSIGYGNIYPCSTAGKIATVIYGIAGIPITLVVLDGLGQILAAVSSEFWIQIQNCGRAEKIKPKALDEDEEKVLLPFSVGTVITIIWMILSSLAFFYLESDQGISFFNWWYFMFISVTTTGFGDITPKIFHLSAVYFFFIIIGMAFFSMCVHIVQDMLENLARNISKVITKEYSEALAKGEGLTPEDSKFGIEKRLKNQPGGALLSKLLGRKAKKQLERQWENLEKMRNRGMQTEILTLDVGTQIDAEEVIAGISVGVQTLRSIPALAKY